MMIPVLAVLIILFSPFVSIAEDTMKGYVQVTLEYRPLFPGKLQVLDGVCRQSRGIECAKASIKAGSETCRQKILPAECQEARALLDTSLCMEGLIYENRTSRGEKILLNLCASDAGYGNMYVREVDKGVAWTNYFLLNDGQTVSFP
jgi:hypothetical protein